MPEEENIQSGGINIEGNLGTGNRVIQLKESRAPYTLAVDDDAFTGEPVLLERNGQPVAAIVPLPEYKDFLAWRDEHRKTGLRSDAQLERDRAAFERLKPELLKSHLGEYAVIKDGELVATGLDEQALVDQVYTRFGVVDLYIKRIESQERIYRIPSPHVVKKN